MDYSYDFSNRREKNRKKIIFIVIIAIVAIMFVCFFFKDSNNAFVSRVASIVSAPVTFVHNIFSGDDSENKTKDELVAENESLKKENDELKLELLESQRIQDENTTLKKMLDISKEYQHFNLKMGKIIFRTHDNWTQTFKIDIGTNDGVRVGQAVIHKDGLVGYISSVADTSSIVTTILDPSTSVSVNISTINEPAIVNGDLDLKSKNKMKLTYIPLDTEISVSDMLYTSGLGEMYPSSIPVGKISEIVNSKNDVNRYAIVEPCVNISKINEVAVIIN